MLYEHSFVGVGLGLKLISNCTKQFHPTKNRYTDMKLKDMMFLNLISKTKQNEDILVTKIDFAL